MLQNFQFSAYVRFSVIFYLIKEAEFSIKNNCVRNVNGINIEETEVLRNNTNSETKKGNMRFII